MGRGCKTVCFPTNTNRIRLFYVIVIHKGFGKYYKNGVSTTLYRNQPERDRDIVHSHIYELILK